MIMKSNIDNVNFKNDIIVARKGLMIHENVSETSLFIRANKKYRSKTKSSLATLRLISNTMDEMNDEFEMLMDRPSLDDPPKTLYKSNYLSMSKELSGTRASGNTKSNQVCSDDN